MTREDFNRMPKPLEGAMWLKEMETMAEELKAMYIRVELEHLPDPDVNEMMEGLIAKAAKDMAKNETWNDPRFVEYTYFALLEEAEKWDSLAKSLDDRHQRAECMLRTQVLVAFMHACLRRAPEVGGKIEESRKN